MKFCVRCLCSILLITLFSCAGVLAQDNWVGVQLPYMQFGHLWNTDNGQSDGNPVNKAAATATINSFVFLENTRGLELVGTDILFERDAFALNIGFQQGWERDWWVEKVHWWQGHQLDVRMLLGYVHERLTIADWYYNQNLNVGWVPWDWMWDQLIYGADVELELVGASDPSIQRVVTLTSLHFNDTNYNGVWDPGEQRKIDFLDPDNPTYLVDVFMWEREDLAIQLNWQEQDWLVSVAFAENPDIPEPSAIVTGLFGCVWFAGYRLRGRKHR